MQLTQLLSKSAVLELLDIKEQPTGVKIHLKSQEDKSYRQAEREEYISRPAKPRDENSTEIDFVKYFYEMDDSIRRLLGHRIIKIEGLDDFDNSRESIAELMKVIPVEYVNQITDFLEVRSNFF